MSYVHLAAVMTNLANDLIERQMCAILASMMRQKVPAHSFEPTKDIQYFRI